MNAKDTFGKKNERDTTRMGATTKKTAEIEKAPEFIALTGTHTSATATEYDDTEVGYAGMGASASNVDREKRLCFNDNSTLNNVQKQGKMIEIKEKKDNDEISPRFAAKRRKRSSRHRPGREEFESPDSFRDSRKRKRCNDDQNVFSCGVPMMPNTVERSLERITVQNVQPESNPLSELKLGTDNPKLIRNDDLDERFQHIMDLFDNFTKNLESLQIRHCNKGNAENPFPEQTSTLPERRETNWSSEMRCKRNVTKIGKILNDRVDENNNGNMNIRSAEEIADMKRPLTVKTDDVIINIEEAGIATPEQEAVPTWVGLPSAQELPRWRQGLKNSPISSAQRDFGTAIRPKRTMISSQTSQHQQVTAPFETTKLDVIKEDETGEESTILLGNQEPVPSEATQATQAPPEAPTEALHLPPKEDHGECRVNTIIVGTPMPESPIKPLIPTYVDPLPVTSDSRQTLAKVDESQSMVQMPGPQVASDRTFHTIQIDTTSSPTSSVMRRPPLCMRFWRVLTDIFSAICMCLQVNKDCIFCLAFFVVFVVSASFLTAFFYRTLSINPQFFQPPSTPSLTISTSPHDPPFYYY